MPRRRSAARTDEQRALQIFDLRLILCPLQPDSHDEVRRVVIGRSSSSLPNRLLRSAAPLSCCPLKPDVVGRGTLRITSVE